MKTIDVSLKVITFGQMKSFMTDFITTIGQKVYVPEGWDLKPASSKAAVIRHERIHMRQSKRHGRIMFSIAYLLIPLPIFFAYFRKKFEQEAYEESLRAIYEYHGELAFTPRLKSDVIDHFTTSQYFWMWPFKKNLETWYDNFVAKLLQKNN